MKYKGIFKLLLSLAMIALIIHFVKIDALREALSQIRLSTALLVVFIYWIGQMMSTAKWCLIARSAGINASYGKALKAYFIGMFVNCFGLGMVGGDVARGVLIAHGEPKKAVGIATVIADRAHGLAVLAIIGMCSILFFGTLHIQAELVYALFALGGAIVLGWFIGPPLVVRLMPRGNAIREKVAEMSAAFPRSFRTIILITVISVVFHLVQISLHWVMADGIGAHIPWAYLLVVIPFVNIFSSLPIGWNGLGVRESAYIFFLSPHLISQAQALSLGAMIRSDRAARAVATSN
jgi:glycosyltransferase 2 family protein